MSGRRGSMAGSPGTEPRDAGARFDVELGRVARSLVSEPLPRDILAVEIGPVRARRSLPGFAVAGVAAVVLLLVSVGLAPVLLPGSSATPGVSPATSASPASSPRASFRATADISADFVRLGYACGAGAPLQTVGSGVDAAVRESAVCTAPADVGPLMAAAIVEESARGAVVGFHAKADIVGEDTKAARLAVADTLAKAVAIAVQAGAGTDVAEWVKGNVPALAPDGGRLAEIDGYVLKLVRNANGGYLVTIAASPGT